MSKARRITRRIIRGIGIALVTIVALAVLVVYAAGMTAPVPGAQPTPAGIRQNQALYLTMRDGVRIAVDVWLPAKLARGERVPTIIRTTRYWRTAQRSVWARGISLRLLEHGRAGTGRGLTAAGYAVVLVDARGSGASFGTRPVEWSDDEVADTGQIIDWIVKQAWSDGRVGATGVSYEANTAELATVSRRPALKAVVPQYGDFDALVNLARPGGIFNRRFIKEWNDANQALDAGRLPVEPGFRSWITQLLIPSVKPVDEDPGGRLLRQAVAGHRSLDVYGAVERAPFADDLMGTYTVQGVGPAGRRAAIERSGVPMFVWVGWLDAGTVDGALGRYLSFTNPQRLIIGPWNHGGDYDADPFRPAAAPTEPPLERQTQMLIAYFDRIIKQGKPPERGISYYTMGEGKWHTTSSWPPAGLSRQTWYLAPSRELAGRPAAGSVAYRVDYTATTGEQNRWLTQGGDKDVVYPDRRQEDRKLLTYTSPPVECDLEITGTPVVTLDLSTTERDGAVFAYLEEVAPEGRVTFLTEGMLRLLHRKVSAGKPLYAQVGPYHSYRRADALPVVPGQKMQAKLGLFTTSALIRRGHRIRLAIAGHDASMFERYPARGETTLRVFASSALSLPVRVRR